MNPEKFIGQRLRFTGRLQCYRYVRKKNNKRNRKFHRMVTFQNVCVDNKPFRDHVHMILTRGQWNILHNVDKKPFGKEYTFTAEIHRYTRVPNLKRGEIGRTHGIGLRHIAKVTQLDQQPDQIQSEQIDQLQIDLEQAQQLEQLEQVNEVNQQIQQTEGGEEIDK